jgi:hypothetical protein
MNGNVLNNLENEKNNFLSLKEENKDNIIENVTKQTKKQPIIYPHQSVFMQQKVFNIIFNITIFFYSKS